MTKYSTTAIVLHWLMAAGLAGLFVFGLYMTDLPFSPQKLQFYSWHKWAGVILFMLAVGRILWRLTRTLPPLPGTMSRRMQAIAHAGHGALYLLMLAVPFSGWLMSSAKGTQTVLFGILPLPDLLARNKELGDLLASLHWSLNVALAAVVAGHAAAALKHHFVDKDDVLTRMLPGRHAR